MECRELWYRDILDHVLNQPMRLFFSPQYSCICSGRGCILLKTQFDLCIYITGPGLKSPEERTINYLEEVAIECARGIVNKKIPLRKEKGTMQSKKQFEITGLFSFFGRKPLITELIHFVLQKFKTTL